MKNIFIIATGVCLVGLAAVSPALADKASGPKAKFFAKYDTNHNGVIDEDEKAAIRKDYAANPDGDLKRFDKNKDGKLDDEEIAAIKPPAGKKKSEKTDKTASTNKVDKVEKTEKGTETVK
ncbi:MAG: hypothetical protein QOJ40_2527 [Verrucomicrobiota bacterium]